MPTFYLILPFAIMSIVFFLLINLRLMPYWPVFVPLTTMVLGLVFKYQINWWWYSKFPPKLEKQMVKLLNSLFPYYHNLGPIERKRFEGRMALFLEAKDFLAVDLDKMPEDIRGLIGASATRMTFGMDDYILDSLSVVSVYKSLFVSPLARQPHGSELHDDGVIILAIDRVIQGIRNNGKGFDLTLYEFARVLKLELGITNANFPDYSDPIFDDKILAISGRTKEYLLKHIGQYNLDWFGLSVEHFFHYPNELAKAYPEHYEQLMQLLGQDPRLERHPLIGELKEEISIPKYEKKDVEY